MPQQEAAGGGNLQQLVQTVGQGLVHLSQVAGQANPQIGQRFEALVQEYTAIVQEIAGGGQAAPASVEPGGNPNARPMA